MAAGPSGVFLSVQRGYRTMPRRAALPDVFSQDRLREMPCELRPLFEGSPWLTGSSKETAAGYDAVMRSMLLARADGKWSEKASHNWCQPAVYTALMNMFRKIDPGTNMIRYGAFPLCYSQDGMHSFGKVEVLGAESVGSLGGQTLFAYIHEDVKDTEFDWPEPMGTPVGAFMHMTFYGPGSKLVQPLVAQIQEPGLSALIEMSIYAMEMHVHARIHELIESRSLDPINGAVYATISSHPAIKAELESWTLKPA